MKRETKILLNKAIDSLILSIDHFNRSWDRGRADAFLILLDHSFEMLLKAAILHRGGKIREKYAKQTIGFDKCVRKAVSEDSIKFLTEEEALVPQDINSIRDSAQHHYIDISEELLYFHAQSGFTVFKEIYKRVWNKNLSDILPKRVLPISTIAPKDFIVMFENEFNEIKELLLPNKRRRTEAFAKLRLLAIIDKSMSGEKLQPNESDLKKIEKNIRAGKNWETIFPAISGIQIVYEGEGPELALRITKKEGVPIQLVPEGTPGATVVAVKRVNELDYYNLSCTQLAEKLNLTIPKTTSIIWYLKIKGNLEYHKEIVFGKTKFNRYSKKALDFIKKELEKTPTEQIWKKFKENKKKVKT